MSNINPAKTSETEKRIDAWLKGYDKGFREGRLAQSRIDPVEALAATWTRGYWQGYKVGTEKPKQKRKPK